SHSDGAGVSGAGIVRGLRQGSAARRPKRNGPTPAGDDQRHESVLAAELSTTWPILQHCRMARHFAEAGSTAVACSCPAGCSRPVVTWPGAAVDSPVVVIRSGSADVEACAGPEALGVIHST